MPSDPLPEHDSAHCRLGGIHAPASARAAETTKRMRRTSRIHCARRYTSQTPPRPTARRAAHAPPCEDAPHVFLFVKKKVCRRLLRICLRHLLKKAGRGAATTWTRRAWCGSLESPCAERANGACAVANGRDLAARRRHLHPWAKSLRVLTRGWKGASVHGGGWTGLGNCRGVCGLVGRVGSGVIRACERCVRRRERTRSRRANDGNEVVAGGACRAGGRRRDRVRQLRDAVVQPARPAGLVGCGRADRPQGDSGPQLGTTALGRLI